MQSSHLINAISAPEMPHVSDSPGQIDGQSFINNAEIMKKQSVSFKPHTCLFPHTILAVLSSINSGPLIGPDSFSILCPGFLEACPDGYEGFSQSAMPPL